MTANKIISVTRGLVLFFIFSNFAFAAQEFRVKDGDTIRVKISSKELTRITIFGEGRLDKAWGVKGMLNVQTDKKKGEAYIRPTNVAPNILSFFVRDDLGATYTIIAQQYDIPSETIILKPSALRKSVGRGSEYRATPFVDRVKRLMKGMALGESVDGYSFDDFNKDVPLWSETNIVLRRTYSGHELLGEVYTIQNVSDKSVVFHEREFMDFGGNVQAVALEQLELTKGETTFLYVVRKPQGEE